MTEDSQPTLRLLSLGAGRQSTAVLILSARGLLPRLDGAIFADTKWEPPAVYDHLDRLEREIAQPAGIPIYRVSTGNLRDDSLDPTKPYAALPFFVRTPCATCERTGMVDVPAHTQVVVDHQVAGQLELLSRQSLETALQLVEVPAYTGPCPDCAGAGWTQGRARRQCTERYKLRPILRKVRELLGARPKASGVPGPVPGGRWAEQWIGISTDEAHRALSIKHMRYSQPRFPLLEPSLSEGLSVAHCQVVNASAGFINVPKSACRGCPAHTDLRWRTMRDHDPESFADAVDYDHRMRHGAARARALGNPLRGEYYLHRSCLPLEQAPIDRVNSGEWSRRQDDLVQLADLADYAGGLDLDDQSCSPFACRTGEPVGADYDLDDDPDDEDEHTGEVA